MVKLTPDIIEGAGQYINPVRDRELDLRSVETYSEIFAISIYLSPLKVILNGHCKKISPFSKRAEAEVSRTSTSISVIYNATI